MKTAFLFPGQGAQFIGMGRAMAAAYPAARQVFEAADEALGMAISRLCFEGPEEELRRTVNAQPAILTVSIACLAVLKEKGIPVNAAAGHSLGEYGALVAAEALDFADAVRVVRRRGEFMQEAVPLGAGGMTAVLGLDAAAVEAVCRQAADAGVLEAVNLNCPGQIVIAGEKAALERAAALAKEAGAKRLVPLAVSAPFHSSLMRPAGEKLAAVLASVSVADPQFPVVANVTADYVTTAGQVRQLLIRQVYNPVRWEESMRRLLADGVDLFIEVGPGTVLTGLLRKIDRRAVCLPAGEPDGLEKVLARCGEVG